MESSVLEIGLIIIGSLAALKVYAHIEVSKNSADNESKERKAQIYADGRAREMRIEAQADMQGFGDLAGSEGGIEGVVAQFIQTEQGAEMLQKFLGPKK